MSAASKAPGLPGSALAEVVSTSSKPIRLSSTASCTSPRATTTSSPSMPSPGELGSDTWPSPNDPEPGRAQAWTHGGATIWQSVAIDPTLGMLYFSTGNAGPQSDGAVRPGDNLFTASILALDYKSGQYKWHFQEEHHEIWDDDAPSPVVLFDQMYNGQMRKCLYECGKTSW